MPQSLNLSVKGLFTNFNDLSEVPIGGLKVADNIVINKNGIGEPRRGMDRLVYTLPLSTDRADKLLQYQDTLLVHYDQSNLAYYSDTQGIVPYQGTFTHPDTNLAKIRGAEANQNLYLTTSNGIQRLDAVTHTPVQAGMFKGLDCLAVASANSSGFMSNNSSVAYRMMWGITDANDNLIEGFPSQPSVINNTSGGAQDALVSFTIPAGVTVNHFFQIYRGDQIAALVTSASAVLQDLTYTAVTPGSTGNSISVTYVGGGTAGSEKVTVSGSAITVTIASGASTANDIQNAINNSTQALALVSVLVSGTGSNTETTGSVTLSGAVVTPQTPDDNMQLVYEGTVAGSTLVVQDITYTSIYVGLTGNLVSVAYTGGAVAGSEVVTVSGNAITVQIDSGVSTAEQVLAAINGSPLALALVSAAITGVSTNAQVIASAVNLSGGTTSVSVVDSLPDSLRGAALYTNQTQQGILQANELPPYANDIATFMGCLFFANIQTKQQKQFSILAAGGTQGVQNGDTITIAGTTYKASNGTGAASYQFTITAANATAGATYTNNGQTFTVSETISGSTTLITTGTGTPATSGTLTLASGTGSSTITFSSWTPEVPSALQYELFTTESAAQDINDSALSLIRVINQNTTNTSIYAYYMSTPTGLPGQILVEARTLGTAAFSLTASAHGTAFSPAFPTSGTSVTSTNLAALNGLMYSKQQTPDAVPIENILYIGSASKKILRILALRDALFVLKEDGIYICMGTSPFNFEVYLIDNTAILLAPESAVTLNNQIYALTTLGVVSISEIGVQVLSWPIQDQLNALNGTALTGLQYYSFGVGYESEHQYILWTVTESTDTSATQAFVYNLFTQAWTRWTRNQQHAIILSADNLLYAADPNSNYINQERKSETYSDYTDEALPVTITSFSGYNLVLTSVVNVSVGDVIYQSNATSSVVTAVDPTTLTVTVTDLITNWSLTAPTYVLLSISCTIEWVPNFGQSAGFLKQWSEALLLLRQSYFDNASVNFYSDVSGSIDSVPITGNGGGLWGRFLWGLQTWWGGISNSKPIRTYVPLEKQRCDLLSVQFTCSEGWAVFQLEGIVLINRLISSRVGI